MSFPRSDRAVPSISFRPVLGTEGCYKEGYFAGAQFWRSVLLLLLPAAKGVPYMSTRGGYAENSNIQNVACILNEG